MINFEISAVIPATPDMIYDAWLNSEEHSQMTGGLAKVSAHIGDTFEAWDGYIQDLTAILFEKRMGHRPRLRIHLFPTLVSSFSIFYFFSLDFSVQGDMYRHLMALAAVGVSS